MFENIIHLIQVIVWPFVLFTFFIFMKKDIKQLFFRLSNIEFGGVKANLSEVKNSIKELDIKSDLKHQNTTNIEVEYPTKEDLLRIAEISPKAAIMETWRNIEIKLNKLARNYNIEVINIAGGKTLQQLVDQSILPRKLIEIYHQMRIIRSKVAHSPDYFVKFNEAIDYINSASEIFELLAFSMKTNRKNKTNP
jgi:hypothetical protein